MAINPHLTPRCDFCVHSIVYLFGNTRCSNDESEYSGKFVMQEAKDCNLYRTDTNPDELKEQQKESW